MRPGSSISTGTRAPRRSLRKWTRRLRAVRRSRVSVPCSFRSARHRARCSAGIRLFLPQTLHGRIMGKKSILEARNLLWCFPGKRVSSNFASGVSTDRHRSLPEPANSDSMRIAEKALRMPEGLRVRANTRSAQWKSSRRQWQSLRRQRTWLKGSTGRFSPKTPACYGFTVIAKIIPGREPVFLPIRSEHREDARLSARVPRATQAALSRWVLFPVKGETYFMYQGIFDTDFDKIHRGCRGAVQQRRHLHGL
jgi:hypothetical protein